MTLDVDLIVLGTGSAAQSVAFPCREAGWSVTVVDSDPFGGTCSLRGCDPKKVLVGVSELVDWGRRMQGKGLSAPAPALAWSEMLRFKRTFVDDVPAAMDQSFKDAGMLTVHGRARFVDSTSLRIGDETYVANHVVIAAGARHGAAVSILHRGQRPLEGFDADLVAQLVQTTRDLGVDVHVRTSVTAIEK